MQESKNTTPNTIEVPIHQLYLDPNNYRFIDSKEYQKVAETDVTKDNIQIRTRRLIEEKGQEGIKDLLASLKANGFLPIDMIQVEKIGENQYKVVEGNRRVAAVKFLQEEYKRANYIGKFNADDFEKIPVTLYNDADETHHLILMGLKHISGNKKWAAVNQAQLLKSLQNKGLSEEKIRDTMGITTQQLRRFLRTLALIDEYKKSDFGEYFTSDKFTLFDDIIRQTKLKDWLGWIDDYPNYRTTKNDNTHRLFSWLSKVELDSDENKDYEDDNLEDRTFREPIITKREEIRKVGDFIDDEALLQQMEKEGILTVINSSAFQNRSRGGQAKESLGRIEMESANMMALIKYLEEDEKERLQKSLSELKEVLNRTGHSSIADIDDINPKLYADLENLKHFSEIYLTKAKSLCPAPLRRRRLKIEVVIFVNKRLRA